MRKIYIAGCLEILGTANNEYEDLMVHVRKHMGEEVEQMLREHTCPLGSECQCEKEEELRQYG